MNRQALVPSVIITYPHPKLKQIKALFREPAREGNVEKLEIFTLGGVRILRGNKPIAHLSTRKAEALLVYLASTRRPQPREVLADLLWDERTQSQSLANLRVVLTTLRQAVGESLIISRDAVAINPSAIVWLDAAQMEDGLRDLHLLGKINSKTAVPVAQALELYRGDFLEGFSVLDCRRFEDWQVRERERLHHLAIDGFSELVSYDIELEQYQLGMTHAARLLELDPLMESAHRQMMLLLAKCGQRAGALSQYATCQKLLQAELGVQPAEETRNLYEQIRTGKLGMGEDTEQLPSGTVTFLFTDIEASTELLERLREQYAVVLAEHRQLLRSAFKKWHGHEVDTQGDSFFVAFSRATDTIGCAIDIQKRLSEHSWSQGANVRVRMGLHTGEPVVGHTGYVGMDVHRAARIAQVGYGGQVLLSRTTRDLVCLILPAGSRLRDLGAYMLKDLHYPQEIYQLEIPGLPNDFPPLKSLDKLEKGEEPPSPGSSPYMGLQYFDEVDAEWFFGRQAVTARLVEAVCSSHFLAVVGASGSGKSSVVRAGLVPAIKARYPSLWQVKVFTPSSHPLDALAICLTRGSDSVTATASLIDDMLSNPRGLYLYCHKNLTDGKDSRLLLVIDQFEELFTLCRSETERLAFIKNFLYAVGIPDSRMTGVIALRADFYAHLAQYVGLRELASTHQIYIGAMKASELREAIEEPARCGGWEISPGLVDLILSDLGAGANRQPEPGALPLLSHALLETWKHRRGNLLSLKAYTETGGVRGAIAKTAESVFYRDLTTDEKGIAKEIFLRLTELGEGTADTRRRISIKELIPPGPALYAEQIQSVLVKLADARLIITGEGTVEVAHEALIREWPTLREWLASDREGLRMHRHLTEAAQEWELLEKDPGALYRGTRLNQALEWAMANPRALSAGEHDYLEASREAVECEQAEREAARVRELEAACKLAETEKGRAEAESLRAESECQRAEEQGRSAKRLRRRAWLLGGVLLIALILAGTAVVFWRQADFKEREATSRYLNSAALNQMELKPQLSAHLALQALQVFPEDTIEAENTLHKVLPELRLLNSIPLITIPITNVIGNYLNNTLLVKDGKQLILGTTDGIELVDMTTWQSSMLVSGYCDAFIPTRDVRWLVAQCQIGEQDGNPIYQLQVWEIDPQKHLFDVPIINVDWMSMGLVPPSSTHPLLVFAGYYDMTVHIWDVSSGKELFVLSGHSETPEMGMNYVGGIATQDGTRLATFGFDGQVLLWDMETGKMLDQFIAHPIGISFADFSPDGGHLATWGWDNKISVWDLSSTQPSLVFSIDHENAQSPLQYSPDGTRLVAPSMDGVVRVWDAQTGELQLALAGPGNPRLNSFSHDETRLYTVGSDGTIMEWDMTLSHERLTLTGNMGSRSFSFPLGEQLALIAGSSVYIVNSRSGERLSSWQAHADQVTDIAWSPNGVWLATSSGDTMVTTSTDYKVKIWKASTSQLLKELSAKDYPGWMKLDWSPDGSMIASTGYTVTLMWDVASGNLLYTLQQPTTGIGSDLVGDLAFSPDGHKIATGSWNHSLVIWDSLSGSEIYSQTVDHSIIGLSFSPDGQRLAVSQTDGNILFFRSSDIGMVVEPGLIDGDQMVNTLAFSPDGALLAAGDNAGIIRIWDIETRLLRLKVHTFTEPITQVAFSPDGRYLVASSQSGITYFYVLPVDELTELVRSRVLGPMTPEECWEYLKTKTCPPWP